MLKIGYIGVGHMGGALAQRLQLTHPLFVYDINASNLKKMAGAGSTVCSSNREVGEKSDFVLLSLPESNHVREVIFGKGGLLQGLKRGSMIIDQTTGDPLVTRAIAEELGPHGIEIIDAPVSGGPPAAAAGTIAIMVGSTDEQFKRAEPILRAMTSNLFHTGKLGTGQVIKLANNLLNAAQRLLTFEVLALAVKNGCSTQACWEVMVKSSGRNFMLEHTVPRHILTGKLFQGFTLGLMHKDVRLTSELASKSDVPMSYCDLTYKIYSDLILEFGTEGEVNLGVKMYERISGAQITPPGADANEPAA